MAHLEIERGAERATKTPIQYTSKLVAALSKFAGGMTNEVKNPMLEKYGEAYDFLIKGDALRLREETEDAIHAYEKAIQLNPGFVEALRRHGSVFPP